MSRIEEVINRLESFEQGILTANERRIFRMAYKFGLRDGLMKNTSALKERFFK